MSKKDFNSKIRKSNERNKAREQKVHQIEKAFLSESHDDLKKYLAPTKDTVFFKGLNTNVIDALHMTEGDKLVLDVAHRCTLRDFYTEIPTPEGIIKVHYMPAIAPCKPNDLLLYLKQLFRCRQREGKNVNFVLETLQDCDENSIIATSIIEFDDLIAISYTLSSPSHVSLTVSVDTIDIINQNKAEKEAFGEFQQSQDMQSQINWLKIKERNQRFTAMRVYAMNGIVAVQRLVYCYLEGIELPKVGVTEHTPVPKPRKTSVSKPQTRKENPPQPKDPQKCVAYIYYDTNDGKMSIGGDRKYTMKWWIVGGHKRHYTSGKVSDIPPYIKGDKEDPDAQRALQVFIDCHKRIQCYKLVVRH